jgi:transcriptional regulator with XRE-family HTH domain
MHTEPEEVVLLRRLTVLRGCTQRAVARQLGISPTLVSFYANGKRRPTARHLAALRQMERDSRSPLERARDEWIERMGALLSKVTK